MSYNPYQFSNPYQQMYGAVPDQLQQYRQQYQQMQNQQMPFQNQQYQAQQSNVGYIVVNSEDEVLNWIVAPNCSVIMVHASLPVLYLKKADASGKCEMEIYDKRVKNNIQESTANQGDEIITLSKLKTILSSLGLIPAKNEGKKEDTANE